MTDNTEPTIDDLISNLACATHFLPEEDCIYCDTEKIEAIIANQVAKARLDERTQAQQYLHGLTITPESQHLFDVLSRNNHNRIATLKGVKNK